MPSGTVFVCARKSTTARAGELLSPVAGIFPAREITIILTFFLKSSRPTAGVRTRSFLANVFVGALTNRMQCRVVPKHKALK
jgi:hypothetical protein